MATKKVKLLDKNSNVLYPRTTAANVLLGTGTDETKNLSTVEAGAQVNVIDTIKINGTTLTPSNKVINLLVSTEPTADSHIANKKYVDDKIEGATAGVASLNGGQGNIKIKINNDDTKTVDANKILDLGTYVTSLGNGNGYGTGDLTIKINNTVKNADSSKVIDLGSYASTSHEHEKSDITDFAHTHTRSDITDFSHTHTSSDVTDLQEKLDDKLDAPDSGSNGQFLMKTASGPAWQSIDTFKRIVLGSGEDLPSSPVTNAIYMKPNTNSVSGNVYDEYMYVNSAWEIIGTTETELSDYAKKNSPALTGTPTAPTATAGTSSTQIATTAFVGNALAPAVFYEEITD